MAGPRSLADGCASSTAVVVPDVDPALLWVSGFLESVGVVERKALSVTCLVLHPDNLDCLCKAEVFEQDGGYVLEFNRMRGDSVLFSLLFRLLRTYLETGARPQLFQGQLIPRNRLGPSMDPTVVPALELPPAF